MDTKLRKTYFYIGLIIPIIVYIPIFILQDDSILPILDFLDGEYGWLKVLKDENLLLNINGNLPIKHFLFNMPRKYIQSSYDLKRVFFYLFPKYWGFIFYSIFSRIIGFIGMFYLITYYYKNIKNKILISISYSLVPAFTLYGISLLGLPLLFWAILNLYNYEKLIQSYIIIIIFPFWSHIAMIGPFLLLYWLIFIIINIKRKNSKNLIYGYVIYIIGLIIANIDLLRIYLFEITNRSLRNIIDVYPNYKGYIYQIFKILFFGNIHPANFIAVLILIILMYNTFKKRNNLNIKILFILILINTLIYVNITFIVNIFTNYINVLKSFDISRIIIFNTFFYYLIFLEILNNKKIKFTLLIIFQIILNIFSIPEISYNLFKNLINKNILISIVDIDKPVYYLNNLILNENKRKDLYTDIYNNRFITYKEYESSNLMNQIFNYINENQNKYKIVSIGLPPSITQINGFYTLDGDFDILPGKNFLEFRKIIEPEIKLNKNIRLNYDYGGNQLFIYNNELLEYGYTNCYKNYNISIEKLNINIVQLKKMGCKYVFSAVKIKYLDEKMKFLKLFEDNDSIYKIYLYKII